MTIVENGPGDGGSLKKMTLYFNGISHSPEASDLSELDQQLAVLRDLILAGEAEVCILPPGSVNSEGNPIKEVTVYHKIPTYVPIALGGEHNAPNFIPFKK